VFEVAPISSSDNPASDGGFRLPTASVKPADPNRDEFTGLSELPVLIFQKCHRSISLSSHFSLVLTCDARPDKHTHSSESLSPSWREYDYLFPEFHQLRCGRLF
jgi:hypothetical protein